MTTPAAVLVINDEPRVLDGLGELLGTEGYRGHLAPDGETGLRLQREETVRVVLTDLRMPRLDGLTVVRDVRELGLDAEVIAFTGHGSIEAAVAAMKQGVDDFLTKPPDGRRPAAPPGPARRQAPGDGAPDPRDRGRARPDARAPTGRREPRDDPRPGPRRAARGAGRDGA